MHEAGIVADIVAEIRSAGAAHGDGCRIRLRVHGGAGEPDQFDAALLLHVAIAAPDLDPGRIDIVHEPTVRLCTGCGLPFMATDPHAGCPACGGPGLPTLVEEHVDVELTAVEAGG